jgi:signal transduction histidine kinase
MGLRHRSIRTRVAILIVVPVLCLLGLYGFAASITLGSALTQAHAKSIKDIVTQPVSNFEKQLDLERHLALENLAMPGNTGLESELGIQEAATDKAFRALQAAFASPSFSANASSAEEKAIADLDAAAKKRTFIRGDIAANAISIPQAVAQYNSILAAAFAVLDQAIAQQTNVTLVTQATNILNLAQVNQTAVAEADLLNADMMQGKFPEPDRVAFAQLANQRQTMLATVLPELRSPYAQMLSGSVSPRLAKSVANAEDAIISTPWHRGAPPAQVVAGARAFQPYITAMGAMVVQGGNTLGKQSQDSANRTLLQLILAAGLGLIGIVASIVLSLVIGRGLVRQLRELRQSALELAHEKLPYVISHLRAGGQIDVSDYAPADTRPSQNEIEQVQSAFGVVQQTAVQTAIDEARLRRGISDVFRNLAGRSQSLLHRQLTLLDGMERRASEPEELEDLFRIDHLTTRMRRHAEGLIILSGETPARGWRQPVPLIDVLRAAVAEVEDYTRIQVLSRTNAAVAGHAVADVIHMVAELAENATVFSPPTTPVRIQGEAVGRGIVIEIEDRGLGISPARLEEINTNLATPPQFDLSGSDRLGLFIAGLLAQRHDIKITLRPSVYGGTTAIVLLPTALVVDEDSFERDPALPAGRPVAVESGSRGLGRHAALAQPDIDEDSGRVLAADSEPDYASNGFDYSRNGFNFGDRLAPSASGEVVPDTYQPAPSPAADAPDEEAASVTASELAELGLPVRVRQASLAPQLRDSPSAAQAPAPPFAGSSGMPLPKRTSTLGAGSGSSGRGWEHLTARTETSEAMSPEAARSTVSALQRGWQLGRSELGESEPDRSEAGRPEAGHAGSGQSQESHLSSEANPADNADEQGTE